MIEIINKNKYEYMHCKKNYKTKDELKLNVNFNNHLDDKIMNTIISIPFLDPPNKIFVRSESNSQSGVNKLTNIVIFLLSTLTDNEPREIG